MFKSLAAALLVSSVLLQSNATAQEVMPPENWKAVSSRTAGEKVIVKLKQGKTVKGALQSVSEEVLALEQKGKPADLKRDEIASVAVVGRKKSAAGYTLLGAGISGGVGAGIGATTVKDTGFHEKGIAAGLGAVIGVVAGGIVGYFAGRTRQTQSVIYKATK